MNVIDAKTITKNDMIKFINPNKTIFDAQIINVTNDCLGITINVKQDTYIQLEIKQVTELILVYKHEAIRCSTVILGSKQSGIEQIVLISIPKLILRIQRREFERLAIVMDLEYSQLPDGLDYKKLDDVNRRYFRFFKRAYTVDISAGGVSIVMQKDEIDSKFALINLLIKGEKVTILCSKVRTDSMNDFKHNKVAFKYTDIKTQHRQWISDLISGKSKEIQRN